MTICHYVEGKGETKSGYNIITMSVQAWEAHKAHHPDTMDVVYNGVSCPTVTEEFYCPDGTAKAGTAMDHAYDPANTADVEFCTPTIQSFTCPDGTAKAGTVMDHAYDPANTADVEFCTPTGDITTVTPAPEAVAAAEAATVEEPETVAPVLPGTVEEPETVAIPKPATVPTTAPLPATIPAGDGSTAPAIPTYALALLLLGTTALAASTVRLVRTTK